MFCHCSGKWVVYLSCPTLLNSSCFSTLRCPQFSPFFFTYQVLSIQSYWVLLSPCLDPQDMGSLKVPVTVIVDCTTLFQPTLQWVPNIHTPNEEVCFCRDAWIEGLWSSLGQYGNAGCVRKSTAVERTGTTGKGRQQMIFACLWGFAWCFGLALTPLALSSSIAHGTYFLLEGTKVTLTKYFLTDSCTCLFPGLPREESSGVSCAMWGDWT